ncbi:UNVERIFIED_CONTAM: hypothetical protein GTU68_061598 [Idotea baltica]|nr:hypothetical protein [Idotea baltica]
MEEVRLRTRTWWGICGCLLAALVLGRTWSIVFFAFVSYLAFKEYLSLIPTRRSDRRVLFWAYLAIPLQYYWIHTQWYGMFIVFIPVYMFLILPVRMITIGATDGFLRAIGTLHWGLMTAVFSLSHAAYLLILTPKSAPCGPGLLLFLVILTQFNDVAQFCWGKSIGRHKVIPKVSPGKTVEGLVGGVATTVIFAAFLGPYLGLLDLKISLLGGLLIGVTGFFGDVTMSCLKRDLGVKDSGSMLPGHGGILDRVDSLTFTAPLFFHFVWYFYG